jgi:PBP1b-binding outer membrane lipoprotein LpoB
MKKIIFIVLVIGLLVLSGCSKEASQDDINKNTEDQGYISDIDQELDTSDTDSLDEDLNLDWV